MDVLYKSTNEFSAFSTEHLLVLIVYVLFSIVIFRFARKLESTQRQNQIGILLAILPLLAVVFRMLVLYQEGVFTYQKDLPLFVCRIVSFVMPFLIWSKNKKLFGILYFWIIAGTTNALITPDIKFGLPHYESIFYWVIHAGLVMAILYCVFVYRWRPQHKDIWNALLWANIYVVIIHIVNTLLESNYSYTMHKPVNGSILDFFGPWPWYLLTGQLLALALFYLFYLPFILGKSSNKPMPK